MITYTPGLAEIRVWSTGDLYFAQIIKMILKLVLSFNSF